MHGTVPAHRVLIIDPPGGGLQGFVPVLRRAGYLVEMLQHRVGFTTDMLALSAPALVFVAGVQGLSAGATGSIIREFRRRVQARTIFVGVGPADGLASQGNVLGADVSVALGDLTADLPPLGDTSAPTTLGARLLATSHINPEELSLDGGGLAQPSPEPETAFDAAAGTLRLVEFTREQLRLLDGTSPPQQSFTITLDILTENNVYVEELGGQPVGIFVAATPVPEVGRPIDLTVQLPWGEQVVGPAAVEWKQAHRSLRPWRREGFGARLVDPANALGRALKRFVGLRSPVLSPLATTPGIVARPPSGPRASRTLAASPFASVGLLSRLIDQAPVGFAVFDAAGVVLGANTALRNFLGLGSQQGEPEGRLFVNLLHPQSPPEDKQVASELCQVVAGQRDVVRRELRLLGGSQREVWVKLCAVLLKDAGPGAAPCGLALVENVTDQRLVMRELLRGDRVASAGILSAGAAHRINNPLSCVKAGFAFIGDVLRAHLPDLDPEIRVELEQTIRDGIQSSDQIEAVVRDLQVFASEGSHRKGPLAVCAALDRAAEALAPRFANRVRFAKSYGSNPVVLASEADLRQVFTHILLNAAYAVGLAGPEQEREIRLTVQSDDGRAIVEIHDSGSGFDPRYLDHLFLPFESTRSSAQTGLGLGLFVCRSIVEDLGGQVTIESDPGSGSTVRLIFPLGEQT